MIALKDDNSDRVTSKVKIATLEKYEGGRDELRAFLINIELYY